MKKYFTIVVRADDDAQDHAARRLLVPGEKIAGCTITGCSLGDALTLSERLKTLIPDDKEEDLSKLEQADLAPHFAR
jgi:hypothetical protein